MTLLRPCATCGEPTTDTRCPEHTVTHRAATRRPEQKASTRSRGYGTAWRKLSERARRLQPFCTDCGAREDLTVDHTPEAWRRDNAGKAVRLCDVDVVCRPCNSARGRARPSESTTDPGGETPGQGVPTRWGKSKFRTHTALHVSDVQRPVGDVSKVVEDVAVVSSGQVVGSRALDADPEVRAVGDDVFAPVVGSDDDGTVVEDLVGPVVVGATQCDGSVGIRDAGVDTESHGVMVP